MVVTQKTFTVATYSAPDAIGILTIYASLGALIGVFFENHQPSPIPRFTKLALKIPSPEDSPAILAGSPILSATFTYLNAYFAGLPLPIMPPLDREHGTAFQQSVWRALLKIPSGQTATYQSIADAISSPKAVRAVGAAIARNPHSILVPCHRVVGKNRSLTGYAGGLCRKQYLLDHEA